MVVAAASVVSAVSAVARAATVRVIDGYTLRSTAVASHDFAPGEPLAYFREKWLSLPKEGAKLLGASYQYQLYDSTQPEMGGCMKGWVIEKSRTNELVQALEENGIPFTRETFDTSIREDARQQNSRRDAAFRAAARARRAERSSTTLADRWIEPGDPRYPTAPVTTAPVATTSTAPVITTPVTTTSTAPVATTPVV